MQTANFFHIGYYPDGKQIVAIDQETLEAFMAYQHGPKETQQITHPSNDRFVGIAELAEHLSYSQKKVRELCNGILKPACIRLSEADHTKINLGEAITLLKRATSDTEAQKPEKLNITPNRIGSGRQRHTEAGRSRRA